MAEHPGSIELWMVYEDLKGAAHVDVPAPYTLRPYEPADIQAWVRIWRRADQSDNFTPQLFAEQFGTDQHRLRERMIFLCDGDGSPVAAAAAWFMDEPADPPWGRVHWLAVEPAHQGKGLAMPLLSACCRRMVELGHDRTRLSTDSFRLPAINLYLNYGFVPDIRSPDQQQAWHAVFEKLPHHAHVPCRYDRFQQTPQD